MDQSDPQRYMQNIHPVRTIKVVPGSELETLLNRMDREKSPSGYTTLNAVARDGCHAAVARPMSGRASDVWAECLDDESPRNED